MPPKMKGTKMTLQDLQKLDIGGPPASSGDQMPKGPRDRGDGDDRGGRGYGGGGGRYGRDDFGRDGGRGGDFDRERRGGDRDRGGSSAETESTSWRSDAAVREKEEGPRKSGYGFGGGSSGGTSGGSFSRRDYGDRDRGGGGGGGGGFDRDRDRGGYDRDRERDDRHDDRDRDRDREPDVNRPKLKLAPRTAPVEPRAPPPQREKTREEAPVRKEVEPRKEVDAAPKKKFDPFGGARPREEVIKQKSPESAPPSRSGTLSRDRSFDRQDDEHDRDSGRREPYRPPSRDSGRDVDHRKPEREERRPLSRELASPPADESGRNRFDVLARDISSPPRQDRSRSPVAASRGGRDPPEERLKRQITEIVEEYFTNGDWKEAMTCVEELNSSDAITDFVRRGVILSLGFKDKHRNQLSDLFRRLYKAHVVDDKQLTLAFDRVFDRYEDLALDHPSSATLLGQILALALLDEYLRLTYVLGLPVALVKNGTAEAILAACFKFIVSEAGPEMACELLDSSGIDLAPVLNGKEQKQFFKDQKLEALL